MVAVLRWMGWTGRSRVAETLLTPSELCRRVVNAIRRIDVVSGAGDALLSCCRMHVVEGWGFTELVRGGWMTDAKQCLASSAAYQKAI